MFKDHHYLSANINKASRCYVAVWEDRIIGFASTITIPSGTIKNGWRLHRAVVLPEFQGIGLGVRLIDTIAQIHLEQGHKFFVRTSHPRIIYFFEDSKIWKPTSKHKKIRRDVSDKDMYKNHIYDNKRLCGSFEYIGSSNNFSKISSL
jgi:GNAT superfamily N-acetyltransferase